MPPAIGPVCQSIERLFDDTGLLVAPLRVGFTVAQAAEIIDATPNAVYRMAYKGHLPRQTKHQRGGLDLADVERTSLDRYRYNCVHAAPA